MTITKIGWTIIIIMTVGLYLFVMGQLIDHRKHSLNCDELPNLRVSEIGACNRHGECGVVLNDGSYLTGISQPVIGQVPRRWGCD